MQNKIQIRGLDFTLDADQQHLAFGQLYYSPEKIKKNQQSLIIQLTKDGLLAIFAALAIQHAWLLG